jgi:hypothetical protein
MNAIAMMNAEIAARRDVCQRLEHAQERAGEAAAKARLALRLTVRMAATAVNEELDHIPDAQAVARACILKDDIDATCVSIEQYLDDLLFQPLQLLMRQADDR